ncbi:MAG TPA: hypothetical protein VGK73_09695 [Polyangiaceae bacterium]
MRGQPGSTARAAVLGLCALAFGCSVETADDSAQAEGGSTHAVIAIGRQASAAEPGDARADAFAGFLRTSGEVDAASALRVAGLGLDLPPLDQCKKTAPGSSVDRAPVARVELIDAGEVTIAVGRSVTTLAPRAFPTITDAISGVVYTTRDRTASLPPANPYTVATTGATTLGPLSGEARAPAALSGVTLGGIPLAEVESLLSTETLKLAWERGAAGDRVYVELETDAGTTSCTFRDDAGQGSVPAALLPSGSEASISVHRLREASFGDVGVTHGQLRFDFELSAPVSFE